MVRPTAPKKLKSFDEVNQNLLSIADLKRRIDLEESACNEQVDTLKAACTEKLQPLLDDLKKRESLIEEYCKANINEFQEAKTKKLTHGSVSFRESTSVIIADEFYTLEQLRRMSLLSCIRTTTVPIKDQIKQLDPKQLVKIGAEVKTENNFSYKVAKVKPTATAEA